MTFISFTFIVFLAVLMTLLRFIKDKTKQEYILLFASYLFYSAADFRFSILLLLMSLFMWWMGKKITSFQKNGLSAKKYVTLGVIAALLSLGFFKYFNFFIESFTQLFALKSAGTLSLILPLGISFYTFQAISYVCDVYWKKMPVVNKPHKVLLYIAFFPQIVCGPIVKAHVFFSQLENRQKLTKERLSYAIQLFSIGLCKKVVFADRLGIVVNSVYAAPSQYSGISLLMASITYAIQIYCDFSGYSDMAISVAHILGFDYEKNFNLPYIARNTSDFWRRWHISLSSWFRDYVYIPLGGSRVSTVRIYFNLFITMLLSGLWHGAAWTFVFWGAMFGIANMALKTYKDVLTKFNLQKFIELTKIPAIILSVSFIWLLWIPFRADGFGQAWLIINRIFTMAPGIQFISVFTIIYGIIVMAAHIYYGIKNQGNIGWKPLNLSKFWNQVLFLSFLLLIFAFAYIGDTAFIYAKF